MQAPWKQQVVSISSDVSGYPTPQLLARQAASHQFAFLSSRKGQHNRTTVVLRISEGASRFAGPAAHSYSCNSNVSWRAKLMHRRFQLLRGGPDELLHFLPVAEEHEGRPELDAERSAERAAGAVLDLDVPHLGMLA